MGDTTDRLQGLGNGFLGTANKGRKQLDKYDVGTPWIKRGMANPEEDAKKQRLNNVGADASYFGNTAADRYNDLSGRLNGSLDDLQAQAQGKNSVSALQLQQGLQQNLAAQRSMAASAGPQNQAMSARTGAIQMGRLGAGLAGQQAVAGLEERNQAQQQYAGMLNSARSQDGQVALGGMNTAISAYGTGPNAQPTKTKFEKWGPVVASVAKVMSDRRAKTDIRPGEGDADRALGKLNAYSFRYKDDSNGHGQQIGVMAQDLERSGLKQAVINTPSGKMVDGGKLATANTAMLVGLNDRIDELEREKRTKRDRETRTEYRGGLNGLSGPRY